MSHEECVLKWLKAKFPGDGAVSYVHYVVVCLNPLFWGWGMSHRHHDQEQVTRLVCCFPSLRAQEAAVVWENKHGWLLSHPKPLGHTQNNNTLAKPPPITWHNSSGLMSHPRQKINSFLARASGQCTVSGRWKHDKWVSRFTPLKSFLMDCFSETLLGL